MKHATPADGAAIYSKAVLSVYDWYVLGFCNRFVWQCPTNLMLDFYHQHISEKHLDVGVGTGYFLDKCRFPAYPPQIALLDRNWNSLKVTAKRLQRYSPRMYRADVLLPLQIEPAGFGSIALNYLLHCLPGSMKEKGTAFGNLKPLLTAGGKIFGTTILGQGVGRNWLAKAHMALYNSQGVFSNTGDTVESLDRVLNDHFGEYSLQVVGCAAFFMGRI